MSYALSYAEPDEMGGSVMTIDGAGGFGAADAGGPCVSSSCRATDTLLQQLKDAAAARGWPQAIAQRIVAADVAWQALKSSSGNPPAQAVLDTQRTFKALLSETEKMKAPGGGGAPAGISVAGHHVPLWALIGGGALVVLGSGYLLLRGHHGGGAAAPTPMAGWGRRRRRRRRR